MTHLDLPFLIIIVEVFFLFLLDKYFTLLRDIQYEFNGVKNMFFL